MCRSMSCSGARRRASSRPDSPPPKRRRRAAAPTKTWRLWERTAPRWPASFCAPGWRLVVETEDPIFPQGFDPWNVERLSAAKVLHTRWIKLGNASGSLEVLDRHCLTEGAGKHPLFEGVRRATITGLPSAPRIEEADGALKISENGLTPRLPRCPSRTRRPKRDDHPPARARSAENRSFASLRMSGPSADRREQILRFNQDERG
jgi:hypothetical protein